MKTLSLEAAKDRLQAVQIAAAHLKAARIELRKVGAFSAANYAQRALKSAEGAVRHAMRLVGERTPDGTDGQDRESYSDDQDRDSYSA